MKKAIDFCFLLTAILLLASCKQSTVSPAQYMETLKENKGLNKTVTIGAVDYTFRVQTAEAMALRSATDENHQTDPVKYKQRLKELAGNLYVNIEMQLHDGNSSVLKYNLKDRSEYEQRVMYYEFYAREDLRLVCNGKELQPSGYQYENHMDLMPYNTMVVAFPLCMDGEGLRIVFNDRALNNLFIKANFNTKDLKGLPNLILN